MISRKNYGFPQLGKSGASLQQLAAVSSVWISRKHGVFSVNYPTGGSTFGWYRKGSFKYL